MARAYRIRSTYMVVVVAALLVFGATAGLVSLPGQGRTGVAHAAPLDAAVTVRPFTDRGPQARPQPSTKPADKQQHANHAPAGHVLVAVPRNLTARARPEAGAAVVGVIPSGSKYYDVPTTAWVEEVSENGRWGRVELPYVWPRREGWILLSGLRHDQTFVEVHVDLSEHRLTVEKRGQVLFGTRTATGTSSSPTPVGEYFVTDRIPFSGGYLGTFAFGISGIQPRLPSGWSGGNQLAIHGTNDPSTIGTSASAGCMRVSERTLDRLKPLLRLGTPVIVER
ncbi:MAG: L,D-transpeptidase [Actinomycetota bacterium]